METKVKFQIEALEKLAKSKQGVELRHIQDLVLQLKQKYTLVKNQRVTLKQHKDVKPLYRNHKGEVLKHQLVSDKPDAVCKELRAFTQQKQQQQQQSSVEVVYYE